MSESVLVDSKPTPEQRESAGTAPAGARRSVLRKLALTLGLFLILALVSEVGLRLMGYGSYVVFTPDEDLLFVPSPNQHGKTVANHQPIAINEYGLRYPETLPLRDEASLRVVTFGDSVTMGWGVADDHHYSAVLEDRLQGRLDMPVHVQSAGVNAYSTSSCVRRMKRMLDEGHQIDVAILAYSFNHSHETLAALQGDARSQFLSRVRLKNALRRIALYNFLIEGVLREAVYYRIRDRLVAGSWEMNDRQNAKEEEPPLSESPGNERAAQPQLDGPPAWDDHLVAYVTALEEAAEVAAQHQMPLVLVLFGSKDQDSGPNQYQAALTRFAELRSLPLVDMLQVFDGDDHDSLFMDHVHPNERGHERIAEELAPLVASLLKPIEATRSTESSGATLTAATLSPVEPRR